MEAPLPNKVSLVHETARVITERIISGEWDTHLPGERYLSRILEVGRDTVRKAMLILMQDGWISETNKGRKRKILRTTSAPKKRGRKSIHSFVIGFLSSVPLEKMLPSVLFEIYRIEEALAARNATLRVVAGSWAAKNRPDERLKDLFEREKCSLWILYRTSKETQRWFAKKKILCLVRGMPHENTKLPQLDIDWLAIAQHASASLWRKGHRHVALILPDQKLRGLIDARKGVVEFNGEGWNAHIIIDPRNREALIQTLNAFRMQHPEVTAFITTRPRQVLTTMCWLHMAGLRVPDNMSLVSLFSEFYLEELYPPITCYKADPEQVARRVVRSVTRLINGNELTPNSEWIIPEECPGGSVKNLLKN